VKRGETELPTLALALLASLVLWNLPFGGVLLYPFKLLATWLHELSHGVAMIVSGTGFNCVMIYRDTSGLAHASSTAGPFASVLIAAAGYMGTPLWGAALLVVTRSAVSARRALLVVAVLLAATAAFVIGNDFGRWATAAIAIGFAAAGFAVPARWRVLVAHFIAAQACVNALLDIRVLLRPEQVVNGHVASLSDAHNMAVATFGVADPWAVWMWSILWLAWSLAVLFVALRIVGRERL
jgi:hypothetical protein